MELQKYDDESNVLKQAFDHGWLTFFFVRLIENLTIFPAVMSRC